MKISPSLLLRAALPLLAVGAFTVSAHAQGYLVKPMSVESMIRPSTQSDLAFEIANTSDKRATVDVSLEFLGQNQGGWFGIDETKATAEDKAKFPSCLGWIRLEQNSVDLDPLQTKPVKVHVTVPAGVRGTYTAALIVRSRSTATGQVGVMLRFLIPIILQVEGGVITRAVSLVKPLVEYAAPAPNQPAQVGYGVTVKNDGKSMIRVGGKLTVYALVGKNWIPVTSGEAITRRILPNAEVLVSTRSGKRIPSGRYKLEAAFKSDGQSIPKYNAELDVTGDPKLAAITPDATILTDPIQLEVTAQPGAMRSGSISFRNPTDSTVTLDFASVTPKVLEGVALGTAKGTDYSAAAWTTVFPAQLRIGPRQEAKARVVVNMPEGCALPSYYTQVAAAVTIDGEPAGETKVLVLARNKGIAAATAVQPGAPISISNGTDGKSTAIATFSNVGNDRVTPKVDFTVTDTSKLTTFAAFNAESDQDILLPLGTGRYAGAFEPKKLRPGLYALNAVCVYGDKNYQATVPIRVVETKTGIVAEVVDPAKEAAAKAIPAKAAATKTTTPKKGTKGGGK